MEIELRPMRLAEILDRIFQLYRARFLLFLGISAVGTSLELAWSLLNLGLKQWLTKSHLSSTATQLTTSLSSVLAWLFVFAAAGVCVAATNRAVMALYDGQPATIANAYLSSRSSWLRSIWVNTLAFFIAWGSLILVVVTAVLAVFFATRAKTLGQANMVTLTYGASGLLVVLALPLCMWLTLRYALAVPACVQEGLSTLASLKRSALLSHGGKGRIFLILMIVGSAQWMGIMVFMIPAIVLVATSHGHTSTTLAIYTLAASALSSALTKPLYCIGLNLFYLDARVRKEGYDLVRMLERASPPAVSESFATSAAETSGLATW